MHLSFITLYRLNEAIVLFVFHSRKRQQRLNQAIGEEWYFFNVPTGTTDKGDARLEVQGYLKGDTGAEMAKLEIVFVGTPSLKEAGADYTADFAPTTAGISANAIIEFPQQNWVFDTILDPAKAGTFIIKEINENNMSGTFGFKAKEMAGNIITIESTEFKDVPTSQ